MSYLEPDRDPEIKDPNTIWRVLIFILALVIIFIVINHL